MRESSAVAILCFLCGVSGLMALGQTTSPINVNGLTANQITSTPATPGVTAPWGNCSTGSNTKWGYEVVALDAAGGNSLASAEAYVQLLCTILSDTHYVKISTTALAGAVNCKIYRVEPSSVGVIATVPCGSWLVDNGLTGNGTSLPTSNSTGTVAAGGMITAQAFNASGGGAGGEILGAGSPALQSCSSSSPPCVTNNSEFFFQAPSSIGTSWGITLPDTFPSQPGPLLLATASGSSFKTSAAGVATLTDSSWAGPPNTPPQLATVTGSFANGDIVQASVSGGNVDFTASNFVSTAGVGGTFLPTIIVPLSSGSAQVLEGTANVVKFIQFVLPYKTTIRKVVANVATTSAGSFNLGVYDSSGATKLIDTGTISCSTANGVSKTLGSAVDLVPGVYLYAYAATDTTCALSGAGTGNANWLNKNATRTGTAGNLSGGSLPTPTGTLTATSVVVPFGYFEP
jgi:hypothetical protein